MKFLVIRFSSLGDIITTTAFLQILKEQYKESEIYYATKDEFSHILKNQPFVDKVFCLERNENIINFAKKFKGMYFEYVFDLHKNPRSIALSFFVKHKKIKRINKHTLYRYKLLHKHLLFFVKNRDTQYNIDDQIKLVSDDFEGRKPVLHVRRAHVDLKSPIIGLAPGAKWKTKIWPKEYFKKLANMLIETFDCGIAIFGSEQELDIANYIKNGYKNVMNFAGKLSIKQTAEFMANCAVVVSNDSALMHMSVALNIPVVAIFGPTVKEFGFFPKGESIVLDNRDLKCRPCSLHGSNRCPKGHHKCMRDINPESVFNAVKLLLEDN